MIILGSAIVAVVTSIVTGLIVANVNLSPPKTISEAGGSIINAHKCMADGKCEVNSLNTGGTICFGSDCRESWSDGVILIRFILSYNAGMSSNVADIQKFTENGWVDVCSNKIPGSLCNIEDYSLEIMEIGVNLGVENFVKVQLDSENGYLIPSSVKIKITDNYDDEASYSAEDLELLIIPK